MTEQKKTTAEASSPPPSTYNLSGFTGVWNLIKNEEDVVVKKKVAEYITEIIGKSKMDSYRVIFLYDDYSPISQYHSNKIYEAISDLKKQKDILLILMSDGGRIEPAYLISKTCKRLAKNRFVVSAPRRAKSAATLIALGANEIHMGLLSELGPIDPQISGFPALGLTNSLEKIANLSAKFPGSSDMFAKYLAQNLKIHDLGYYDRLAESAVQYAERLLEGKKFLNGKTASNIADHFTNHYKDHSFVIDVDEAVKNLGKNLVKESEPEYELANELYVFLELLDFCYRIEKKKTIRYVGSIENGLDTNNIKN
ncbi:MAG: ATP-dependent Clp protease proteolytic subunit [Alphaproteobacteria bacterium]|nr:ATP-dependent Clp protease proteolytic subunit [Alphaproteobacteria bacterium]